MTNEEILKKAIEKAYDNGYRHGDRDKEDLVYLITKDYDRPDGYTVIFSHDFAKAFWGFELGREDGKPAWAYHLQQTVLYENPLEYLAKFI